MAAQPALLAHHCAEAGLADKAVAYRLKAGQQAMARSAMTEAVAQLQKGLDELADLPADSRRQEQELGLRVALASALAATKGYSATDVGETIARAHALAEQIDRPEHLVPLIYGQYAFHVIRSEHKRALLLAEQIERIGETRDDVVTQLQGRRAQGATRYFLGDFVAARAPGAMSWPLHANASRHRHGISRPLRDDARPACHDLVASGLYQSSSGTVQRSSLGSSSTQACADAR